MVFSPVTKIVVFEAVAEIYRLPSFFVSNESGAGEHNEPHIGKRQVFYIQYFASINQVCTQF